MRAAAIHGDRTQAQRDRALEAFRDGEVQALVATDVAARGIHVDGVACVVHFDLPADAKDYVHRSGRTGRAGAAGLVVSFVAAPAQRGDARRCCAEPTSSPLVTRPAGEIAAHLAAFGDPIPVGLRGLTPPPPRATARSRGRPVAADLAVRLARDGPSSPTGATGRSGPRRGRSGRRPPARPDTREWRRRLRGVGAIGTVVGVRQVGARHVGEAHARSQQRQWTRPARRSTCRRPRRDAP